MTEKNERYDWEEQIKKIGLKNLKIKLTPETLSFLVWSNSVLTLACAQFRDISHDEYTEIVIASNKVNQNYKRTIDKLKGNSEKN